MSGEEVDRAVRRITVHRPDLNMAARAAAGSLTAGEGVDMIYQAALQEFLWWRLPRDYPDDEWPELIEATALLMDELGLKHLAEVARSATTSAVLTAWVQSHAKGVAAFRSAQKKSGVEPPDTAMLAWGSIMGLDEARALETVERALGDSVAAGNLVPGAPRWQAKAVAITKAVLSRPLDLPPGQTLAGLVTTERVGTWISAARHPQHHAWRSKVANSLLNPIHPPSNPGDAVAPVRWLLELAAQPGGAELTQNHYLARETVLAAVERFGWWNWEKPPRSEADVYELSTLRDAANRLRLLRRRGRRLYATARGVELLASADRLWEQVASETEDGEEFTGAVTELVGLRLLQGRVETRQLVADVAPILIAQGWSTAGSLITVADVSFAVHRPLRWWRLFTVIDEVQATWEFGTSRESTPHTIALTADGETMVLAYLRSRAAGPRRTVRGL